MKRQKRIFIDGLGLVEGHFSGVGHYILGIVQGMDQLIEEAKFTGEEVPKVTVIIPYDTVRKFKKFGFKHINYKRVPYSFRVMSGLWYRGWLPPLDLWCGRGVYIFTRFVTMPLAFSPCMAVIFDLSFELHREYSDDKNAAFLSKGVRKSIKKARKIITISRNARREIIDHYNLSENDVVVATPATNPAEFYRRSPQEITRAKAKYGVEGEYILALSNLEPRKNLEALIDAYCRLPKHLTDKVQLLLVGVNGWKFDKLFADILDRVHNGYNITRPSRYVADIDRPAIISGAKMLVYPSLYEGFGMPPLEALACGVPVISADNSSLPEVIGTAGVMVPATDRQALLNAMTGYLKNLDEVSAKAISAGPARAEIFDWAKSAQIFFDEVKGLKS